MGNNEEKLDEVEKKVEEVGRKVEDRSLAMDILQRIEKTTEHTIKRLWFIIILLILLIFAQYSIYTYERLQYDYAGYAQDGEGINNMNVGNDNEVNNNVPETQNEN